MAQVDNLVKEVLPDNRVIQKWHDPQWDYGREYPVDFKVNGMDTPLFLHALNNENNTRDATITIYRLQEQRVKGRHIAIFRNDSRINKTVKSKLYAVCETSFGSLEQERNRIIEFLQKEAVP